MIDSLTEFGPQNGQGIFTATVDNILNGVHKPLNVDPSPALAKMQALDPSLPASFYERTHGFVAKIYNIVDDEEIPLNEKQVELEHICRDEVMGEGPSANPEAAAINFKIARLGAYVFVGATEGALADPKEYEVPEVSEMYRQTEKLPLTLYERRILHYIAIACEIESKDLASGKVQNMMGALSQELPEGRDFKEEESLGDEFIKALLVADF